MKWSDIRDGVWAIPERTTREGYGQIVELPKLALDIIAKQPRLQSNPYVFAGRGPVHIQGFTNLKKAFDKETGINGFSLHDLRRTARSLMARAGVQTEIAERVLGHARPGVEGTYDRHTYDEEKAHALRQLAALIERIAYPPKGGVVVDLPMREARP